MKFMSSYKRKENLLFAICIIVSLLFLSGCIIPGNSPTTTALPSPDSDGDGWTDTEEAIAGTDPLNPDTDNDGYWDPIDANPLVPQTTVPTTMPPTTTPTPTTAPPTTMPPTTTPTPTTAPPTLPPIDEIIFGFDAIHSSDSYCCRTGDVTNKIKAIGAKTTILEEDNITKDFLISKHIDVLVFGVDTNNRLTQAEIDELYYFVQEGGVVWLAAVMPPFNPLLSKFGTQTNFIPKTENSEREFLCTDDDWISQNVDEFYVTTIFTFENLETWDESMHISGYDGYHDWPQVTYKKIGDGYIFCSNISFYKSYYSRDNKNVFDNLVYFMGSLVESE
ncbi:MAG: thrombospondin type 3 repeat-containing protein [Candidatus Methanofastidiosia archaeon]